MDVPAEIVRIEGSLAARKLTVADLCRRGAVARSTWDRWRSGAIVPNMATWARVTAAADALLTPTPDRKDDAA